MHEDPLQCRIYFLTFVESLEMIFSQYTETCEVLLYHQKVGGDDVIEDYAKKAIIRLVPAQDGLFALILWYVAKTLFRS